MDEVNQTMRSGWVGMTNIGPYIHSDEWVFEQKMDGTRGLAVVRPTGVTWYGNYGRLGHTAATQWFSRLDAVLWRLVEHTPGVLVLDGEIMTADGEFHLFDVPSMRFGGVALVAPGDSFERRRAMLEVIGRDESLAGSQVHVVRQAVTPQEKRDLLLAVRNNGGEGVLVKRLDAPYESGRQVDHQLKVKFTKSCDVVVMGRTQSPNSITFGVFDKPGHLVSVGGCSMIGKQEVHVGDVVEVEYLYFTGAAVYQPRLKRKRFDKLPGDCHLGQFSPYSRAAV